MFTGIITDVGEVLWTDPGANIMRARIACSYSASMLVPGASIACSGPCLTIAASGEEDGRSWFGADIGAETLERTTARYWKQGTRLNLERPLKLGDELGGHIVTGHIDGIAEITAIEDFEGMRRITVKAPKNLMRFIAEKGSVALDGTSLTVNGVEGGVFNVLLIPHTLKATNWGAIDIGSKLNLEVDLMARYAARLAGAA